MKVSWQSRVSAVVLALIALAAAGCTERNPRYCGDGVCTDPAFPFCDVDGMFGELKQQCVAVDCPPGDFVACRSDEELRCNATGTNYTTTRCELGCDASGGCRLCEPNQTACTNGQVATCDAAGAVVSTEPCPLGCFEDEPRCREIAPSNSLGTYMDMAASGPDLVLENATLRVPLGRVTSATGQTDLPYEITSAPQDGLPIQVFPVRSLTVIGTLTITSSQSNGVPAVAFVVHGATRIDGTIRLEGEYPDPATALPPPGSITAGPCVGSVGVFDVGGQPAYGAGGGGGGGATQGGAGGGNWKWPGSPGGAAFPNPDLQPLRGGCHGGSPVGEPPVFGGGAIQITSRTSIELGANSTIRANGGSGFVGQTTGGEIPGIERMPKGGGSGGGILLEAPRVTLESGAVLTANGGAGVSGDGTPGSTAAGSLPAFGGECTLAPNICTNGGDGGSSTGPGRSAVSIPTPNLQEVYTGAGGGAAGHIRVNTRDAVYTKASDVFESPVPSIGTIATR